MNKPVRNVHDCNVSKFDRNIYTSLLHPVCTRLLVATACAFFFLFGINIKGIATACIFLSYIGMHEKSW
jgi:hypothetical protein